MKFNSDVPGPETLSFDAKDLRHIADALRQVAPMVVDDTGDSDLECIDNLAVMRNAVTALESFALSIDDDRDRAYRQWKRCPSFQALNGFIAAWYCRDKQRGVPKVHHPDSIFDNTTSTLIIKT